MPVPLQPDREEMLAMGREVLGYVVDFLEDRKTAPASDLEGAWELARSLRRPPPESGEPLPELIETIRIAAGKAYDTAGPGYLAYIPGGGLFGAAMGDLIACVTNRFVNLAAPAPALVQLEANVVRWLCDLFDLPPGSQGILTSGGSLANLSAVITARTDRLPENFLSGTLYMTPHVHHSMTKAARLAGFPSSAVKTVACTPELRMDVDALRDAVRRDRAGGLAPFMVVGSAGTVNTGAVDPLDDIAAVCEEEELWYHVDAAYGGFFQLTERGRARFAGIERADSITLDPHKGMFLPYGTGSLIVRDGAALRAAHRVEADYLPAASVEAEIPDFAEYSPELSRDFRGLRVWLPLHLHGIGAFRAALDEKLDLTKEVYGALSRSPGLSVPWEPDLSIVAFHPVEGRNDAAAAMLERINASKRVYLSSTFIEGRMILRVCILSHRTHRDRIEEAIEIIQKAGAEV